MGSRLAWLSGKIVDRDNYADDGAGKSKGSGASFLVASYQIDANADDISRVLAFGRVKVLSIDSNGTPRMREDSIGDTFGLEATHAVFGSPVDAVTDQTVAATRKTSLSVDAEGDTKLVFA